jgi:hypothetical protein
MEPVNQLEEAKKVLGAIEVVSEEQYQGILDEILTLRVQTVKLARETVIEYKWKIGDAIVSDLKRENVKEYVGIVKRLSVDVKISESEIYRCIEFRSKYPDLEKAFQTFDEGENVSWDKIRQKYLPEQGLSRLSLAFPHMDTIDKWGLVKWWEQNPDKNFILYIKDPKYRTQLKVTIYNHKEEEMTPLKEAFFIITNYYIDKKKIEKSDLDSSDYGRIHRAVRQLLLKSKGDMEKIRKAIDWVAGRDYIEWSIETVVKKYAEAMRPVASYEKYLKKKDGVYLKGNTLGAAGRILNP